MIGQILICVLLIAPTACDFEISYIYYGMDASCTGENSIGFNFHGVDYELKINDTSETPSVGETLTIKPQNEKSKNFEPVSLNTWFASCSEDMESPAGFSLGVYDKYSYGTVNGNYISKRDLSSIPDDGQRKEVRILRPYVSNLYISLISEIYDMELEQFLRELNWGNDHHVDWLCSADSQTVMILINYYGHVPRMFTRIDFTDPESPKTHGARIVMEASADQIKYSDFCDDSSREPIRENAYKLKTLNANAVDQKTFCSSIPNGFIPDLIPDSSLTSDPNRQIDDSYIIGFDLADLNANGCVELDEPKFLHSLFPDLNQKDPSEDSEQSPVKNSKKTPVIIIGATCVGVFLIIGAVLVIYRNKKRSADGMAVENLVAKDYASSAANIYNKVDVEIGGLNAEVPEYDNIDE
ncbi:MAG: hypothetical protein MHMPM18_001023 [Marteilia pararefringens]